MGDVNGEKEVEGEERALRLRRNHLRDRNANQGKVVFGGIFSDSSPPTFFHLCVVLYCKGSQLT